MASGTKKTPRDLISELEEIRRTSRLGGGEIPGPGPA